MSRSLQAPRLVTVQPQCSTLPPALAEVYAILRAAARRAEPPADETDVQRTMVVTADAK